MPDPSQIMTSEVLHEVLGKCSTTKIDPSPRTHALAMLSLKNLIETLAKVDPLAWGDLLKPYQSFVRTVLSKKDLFQKDLSSSRKDILSSFRHGAHLWAKTDQYAKERKYLTGQLRQLAEEKQALLAKIADLERREQQSLQHLEMCERGQQNAHQYATQLQEIGEQAEKPLDEYITKIVLAAKGQILVSALEDRANFILAKKAYNP